MKEIWKAIPGYKSIYDASNFGNIRSYAHQWTLRTGKKRKIPKILRPGVSSVYRSVVLYKNNHKKTLKVSTLVALTFIGKKPKGYVVNHLDCNPLNDCYKNLEYCTPQQNTQHAWANNRCPVKLGINHPNHKLTPEQVLNIRK